MQLLMEKENFRSTVRSSGLPSLMKRAETNLRVAECFSYTRKKLREGLFNEGFGNERKEFKLSLFWDTGSAGALNRRGQWGERAGKRGRWKYIQSHWYVWMTKKGYALIASFPLSCKSWQRSCYVCCRRAKFRRSLSSSIKAAKVCTSQVILLKFRRAGTHARTHTCTHKSYRGSFIADHAGLSLHKVTQCTESKSIHLFVLLAMDSWSLKKESEKTASRFSKK